MKTKQVKHKKVKCDVKGCKIEAEYWIDTAELSGDFDMKGKDTFYMCADHMTNLSEDGDVIRFLNPETGRIREVEIGGYACSPECNECNQ